MARKHAHQPRPSWHNDRALVPAPERNALDFTVQIMRSILDNNLAIVLSSIREGDYRLTRLGRIWSRQVPTRSIPAPQSIEAIQLRRYLCKSIIYLYQLAHLDMAIDSDPAAILVLFNLRCAAIVAHGKCLVQAVSSIQWSNSAQDIYLHRVATVDCLSWMISRRSPSGGLPDAVKNAYIEACSAMITQQQSTRLSVAQLSALVDIVKPFIIATV